MMDLQEMLDVVRAEERERCLMALIEREPTDVCKAFVAPNQKTEMAWVLPALREAIEPKRRIALPRHVLSTR